MSGDFVLSSQSSPQQALLITGVSSGIGLGMTKEFLRSGYRVFGSVRSRTTADELGASLGPNFVPLIFDICDPEQIDAATEVLDRELNGHLVALINNAGSAKMGPLLYLPLEELRHQLETLVVGQLGVIQKMYRYLLPRDARDAHLGESTDGAKLAARLRREPSGKGPCEPGRIINISSVSGSRANPFFGGYAAGKHALEGLSKTLRWELQRLGIRVIVVAPNNIATMIWPKQTEELISSYEKTFYYQSLKDLRRHINQSIVKNALSVEEFSRMMPQLVALPEPAAKYTVVKTKPRWRPLSEPRVRLERVT